MDRLQAMATFVRVVERGSFSAVARESGTTQSAVSKQVAALEQAVGAALIVRSTRALALTEPGQHYFEFARRIVGEVSEAEASIRSGETHLCGWIRIAASVAFGRIKLMPIVRAFMERHPEVKVDLRLDDGFVDLVQLGIDVAVRVGELSDSGLIARRVGTAERVLVAHGDYLASLPPAERDPCHPESLTNMQCLVYTELASRNAWRFIAPAEGSEGQGTTVTVRVGGRLQTNSSEVIREATLAGMGVAFTPNWLFATELARGELKALLPGWSAPSLPIHCVYPPERRQSAKVRAFAAAVAEALSTSPALASSGKRHD